MNKITKAQKGKPVVSKIVQKAETKAKAAKKEEIEEEDKSSISIPSSESEEAPPKQTKKTTIAEKRAKPEEKKIPPKKEVAKKTKKAVAEPKKAKKESEDEDMPEVDDDEEKEEVKEEKEVEEEEKEEEEKEEEVEEEKEADNKDEEEQEEEKGEGEAENAEEEAGAEEEGEVDMFIGNLPFSASEEDISSFFSQYGEVVSVKLNQRDGRPSGNGFISFAKHSDAVKAKEANGQDFNGRAIAVRFSSEPAPERPQRQAYGQQRAGQGHSNENTIFIGGLSYQSTRESVSELFSQCGNITAVRIATDQEGNPRGFAHIEFDSTEAVQEAMKLTGSELDGRSIRVDTAGNKAGNASGGFQGAPRRGGRGGFGGDRGGFRSRGGFGGQSRGFGGGNRRGGFGGAVNKNKGSIQHFEGKRTKLE